MNRSKPATARRLKAAEEHGIPMIPITHPLEMDLETTEEYLEEMRKQGGRSPTE